MGSFGARGRSRHHRSRLFARSGFCSGLAALGASACNPAGANAPANVAVRDAARGAVERAESWTLRAPGIEVEVRAAPYGLRVKDGSGRVVLESVASPGAGYAALDYARGSVEYAPILIAGYTSFTSRLDGFGDALQGAADQASERELVLTLRRTEHDEAPIRVKHSVRDGALRVEAELVGSQAPRAWEAAFEAPATEGYLGFGERFNRTDQRGKDVWSWVEEGGVGKGEGTLADAENPLPLGEMMTYYAVPFFLSTEGYGFWLDTTYRSEFNLASSRGDAWRAWHVGPTLAYEVYVPKPEGRSPWPYQIIDGFTAATGRPMLPPAWAFGPRRRVGPKSVQNGQSELVEMRQHHLAVTAVDDALHFYPSGSHIGRERELAEWTAKARALGYRVNGYYNSFVDRDPARPIATWAKEGRDAGYYVRLADGDLPSLSILTGRRVPSLYLVDFTNPQATEWYESSFAWALSLGYSGWMYDFGEYVPAAARAADGSSGEALHNLYPVLYAKALHGALEKSSHAGDWLAFQRSGYTGSSAYVPFVWSGDPAASFEQSDGLPSMVPAGVNLGISGAPHWGGDIGGFHCLADGLRAADGELVARWIQMGSMTSNMMDQNACVGGERGVKASIWTAPDAMAAWAEYARLHTRLFPYLYTLAHEASASGAPVMRHPFLEHPDHPELRSVDDAYYFGPSLYVMPVLERGARSVTRQLPPGSFLDWHDQTLVSGANDRTQTRELPAPLEKLPLLLRENHLVPLLDASIETLADESSPTVVGPADVADVYDVVGFMTEGGTARFALWDGDTFETTLSGPLAPPATLEPARDSAALASCDGCYRLDELPGGVVRLRASSRLASIAAGGLTLSGQSRRRIRWDIYVPASLAARTEH